MTPLFRFALLLSLSASLAYAQAQPVSLTVQDDEARAALAILDAFASKSTPSAAQWTALYNSDGYKRLQKREASMRRAFTDSSFAKFLERDTMIARHSTLQTTLNEWRKMDLQSGARQALRWLPAGAKIRATVYLLIKPVGNSFVFETDSNPAIMLFLDPEQSAADYTNHVVHELHHIGFSSICKDPPPPSDARVKDAQHWLGAFGEGLAMLAAADGPSTNPHATGSAADRARWDHDVGNFNTDLQSLQEFFRNILDGKIVGDSITTQALSYYGVQGPWYTVGWKMAATIVERSGREKLLATMCNRAEFLKAFNAAASTNANKSSEHLATWNPALLNRLGAR